MCVCVQARQNFGIVEMDGLVFVLGGENEETELLTMEVFDPHFKTWTTQTSMTMVRKVGHTHTNVSQKKCVSPVSLSHSLSPWSLSLSLSTPPSLLDRLLCLHE